MAPGLSADVSAHRVSIRLAQLADVGPVKALLDQERKIFGFVRRAAVEAAWRDNALLVALTDDAQIIGFVRFHHRRDATTTIYEIAVSEGYRRRGIGRALVRAVCDDAGRQAKERVCLKCPHDLPANAFYLRLGFVRIGSEPGRRVTVNVWEKDLSDR